jgi:hypothetical protein
MSEVEVTDPTHPLYGRRFGLAAIRRPRPTAGHVLVTYGEGMLLRLPIEATNLASVPCASVTKLTRDAVSELVALGTQDELSWAFGQKTSGEAYPQTFKKK